MFMMECLLEGKSYYRNMRNGAVKEIEGEKIISIAREKDRLNKKNWEVEGDYNITGHNRYYKKMNWLKQELDDLEEYENLSENTERKLHEVDLREQELSKFIDNLKNKVFYLSVECAAVWNIKQYVDGLTLDHILH